MTGPKEIDIICQYRYRTDFECFCKYQENFIGNKDKESPNLSHHSDYLKVACDMPGTIIKDFVFSVKAYCNMLEEKGGNIEAFDTAITEKFPKAPKGSWYTDPKAVEIQCPNGINMQYDDEDNLVALS